MTLTRSKSDELFSIAQGPLVDGYARPLVRSPYPYYLERGDGCWVWDVDGEKRLDFNNNFTTLIHGHCHPEIVRAVRQQAKKSFCSHMPGSLEARLAGKIVDRIPSVEKVRFWNTGTEAVMLSIKMARAITGKSRVAKIEGGYHGQYDLIEASFMPGPEAWGDPSRPNTVARHPGTPQSLLDELLVVPCNDVESTRALLQKNATSIGAMIVCPMQVQLGYGRPSLDYLQMLRDVCSEHNIMLIFDEVVALRDGYTGTQGKLGISPDITVMGKFIGGGLPIGAVGASVDIMSVFKTGGEGVRVVHSGTFTANPMTMVAGCAALDLLPREEYDRLAGLADMLCKGVQAELSAAGVPGRIHQYCTGLAKLVLSDRPISNWRDIYGYYYDDNGLENIAALQELLIQEGVITSRLSFALSTPMTEDEIALTIDATHRALKNYEHKTVTQRPRARTGFI